MAAAIISAVKRQKLRYTAFCSIRSTQKVWSFIDSSGGLHPGYGGEDVHHCRAWGDGASWLDRYDGGPHEAAFLKLDCGKVKETFGWNPRLHVDEAVGWTVEWTKQWLAGADMPKVMDAQIGRFFGPGDEHGQGDEHQERTESDV